VPDEVAGLAEEFVLALRHEAHGQLAVDQLPARSILWVLLAVEVADDAARIRRIHGLHRLERVLLGLPDIRAELVVVSHFGLLPSSSDLGGSWNRTPSGRRFAGSVDSGAANARDGRVRAWEKDRGGGSLNITSADRPGYREIALTGRLNLTSVEKLIDAVDRAVAEGQARIVLDLAEVPTMDSTGLGALVTACRAARQAGGDLRIVKARAAVRELLERTNVVRVLPLHASPDEAFPQQ
jgi:anti-anti-sigma factor